MKIIGTALTCALLGSGFMAHANAADVNEWQVMASTEDGDVVTITTGTTDENGAYISCATDRLTVGVGTIPGNVKDLITASSSERTRTQSSVMTIGDEATDTDWTYYPGRKVAFVRDIVTAKKFYNAAVRGEELTLKMSIRDEVRIQFPELNDAFKAFANDCPVTNPGNQ